MKIKWKKLYSALNTRREEMGISWRQLGRDHGLSAASFTRISQGKSLSAVNFIRMLYILEPRILQQGIHPDILKLDNK